MFWVSMVPGIEAAFDAVTYHDSCAGLRGWRQGTASDPVVPGQGANIAEGELAETCCGFSGLFCVKYPDVSGAMVDRKCDDIVKTGADGTRRRHGVPDEHCRTIAASRHRR